MQGELAPNAGNLDVGVLVLQDRDVERLQAMEVAVHLGCSQHFLGELATGGDGNRKRIIRLGRTKSDIHGIGCQTGCLTTPGVITTPPLAA